VNASGTLGQIGVTLHTADMSFDELLDYAREAERIGYEGVWLTEESGKEAFSLLALLARATTRITLGTGIVSFYSRTPTLLAMGAGTIQRLSGGRFVLGIGSGGIGFVERGHGITIEKPLARARETVDIVRGLLTQKRFDYSGQWFNVRDFHLREEAPETPIPIVLAALGPKMVRLSAEIADGFIANWLTEESLAIYREQIRAGAEVAGRDPNDIRVMTLAMTATEDDAGVEAMRQGLAFYYASPHYHPLAEAAGFGRQAKAIQAVWQTGDRKRAASLVTDAMVETLAIMGSPEARVAKLEWMYREGVYPIIYPVPARHRRVEDHFEVIKLIAGYRRGVTGTRR
jgi:5,10-methylenetetrahydromethanopterin reductase